MSAAQREAGAAPPVDAPAPSRGLDSRVEQDQVEGPVPTTVGAPAAKDASGIQSVHRAMRLLSLFAAESDPGQRRTRWSVSDLARASGLHKSVVARLMATMAIHGFVIQEPISRTYSIGPEAFAVGRSYEPYAVLDQVARPVMERLTAECGHASYLGVPAVDHYVFLLSCESTRSIRVAIEVGERRQYHAGAIGKALISGLDDARIRQIVGPEPLLKLTDFTIDSTDVLLTEIAEVRRTGVAFNRQESILGAGSVAVSIRGAAGDAVAGLGIVYPTHVVTDREVQALATIVIQAGREIEERLRGGHAQTENSLGD